MDRIVRGWKVMIGKAGTRILMWAPQIMLSSGYDLGFIC